MGESIAHPNTRQGHGAWQVRTWLADCPRAGLVLVPPLEGRRAALIAADSVIGDNGATTCYGAVLGRPTLLAGFPDGNVAAGSPVDLLGQIAPRLKSRRSLRSQIEQTIDAHDPSRYDGVSELVTSVPDESAKRLRALFYEVMRLPEPIGEPVLWKIPSHGLSDQRPRPSATLVTVRFRDHSAELVRYPAEVRVHGVVPPDTDDAHVVSHVDHPGRALRSIADVLLSYEDELEEPADDWLRETALRHPDCELIAVIGEDKVLTRTQDGQHVELSRNAPDGCASLVYVWLAEGRRVEDLPRTMTVHRGQSTEDVSVRVCEAVGFEAMLLCRFALAEKILRVRERTQSPDLQCGCVVPGEQRHNSFLRRRGEPLLPGGNVGGRQLHQDSRPVDVLAVDVEVAQRTVELVDRRRAVAVGQQPVHIHRDEDARPPAMHGVMHAFRHLEREVQVAQCEFEVALASVSYAMPLQRALFTQNMTARLRDLQRGREMFQRKIEPSRQLVTGAELVAHPRQCGLIARSGRGGKPDLADLDQQLGPVAVVQSRLQGFAERGQHLVELQFVGGAERLHEIGLLEFEFSHASAPRSTAGSTSANTVVDHQRGQWALHSAVARRAYQSMIRNRASVRSASVESRRARSCACSRATAWKRKRSPPTCSSRFASKRASSRSTAASSSTFSSAATAGTPNSGPVWSGSNRYARASSAASSR